MISRIKKRAGRLLLIAMLLGASILSASATLASDRYSHRDGFDDEYIFATTRSVNDMEMSPALKLTLFPATVVIDTVFLPFAVIAGFVS